VKIRTYILLFMLLALHFLSVAHAEDGEECALISPPDCSRFDTGCQLQRVFILIINWVYCHTAGAVGSFISGYLYMPAARLGIAVPTFSWPQSDSYATPLLADAMRSLYDKALVISVAVAVVGFMLSLIFVLLEQMGVERAGEGLASAKRILLVAVLLPVLDRLYDAFAHAAGVAAYIIAPPKTIEALAGWAAGLSVASGLLLLVMIAVPIVSFLLLILAAMKLLLTAVLAALLPLGVSLSLVPWRIVREAGLRMLSMLVNLVLASILTAAVYAFGAALIAPLDEFLTSTGSVGLGAAIVAKTAVVLASLAAPALGLVMAPRAGIVMTLTAMAFGYAVRPIISTTKKMVTTTVGIAMGGPSSSAASMAAAEGDRVVGRLTYV